MGALNDIIDVTISIESPAADGASFNTLLLVVPEPKEAGSEIMGAAVSVRDLKELEEYGYTSEESAYSAALMAFSQDPRPNEVYVTARAEEESVEECLNRAVTVSGWYGFVMVGCDDTADIQLAAKWAEANGKLFGYSYTEDETVIDFAGYENTFVMYAGTGAKEVPEGNKYAAVAFMAACFGYEPGSETWALKTLRGISPAELSASKAKALKEKNVNFYRTVAGRNVTQGGKVGNGEWIDVIRMRQWLLNEIQFKEFAYLAQQPKVPFNDGGITGIQNVLEAVLSGAQKSGGIDEDRYDEDGKIEKGFQVFVPRSSSISAAEKKSRVLTGVTFKARIAGAIHAAVIKGTLTY